MLKLLSAMVWARISYHLQAITNSINLLCQKPMATLMTIIVIAITLTLPALFWVFNDNLQNIIRKWQHSGHISLYLKTDISTQQAITLAAQIRRIVDVAKVEITTAAEGLAKLQQQEGMQDIMRYLSINPLPAVIEVTPKLMDLKPVQMQQLLLRLKALPAVELAKLDLDWIKRLHVIVDVINKIEHAVMILLALAVILIIGNILRFAIHNRHEEIQVLKLVGATSSYIARPFLYSGIWYSLVGAILAVLLVNIFMLSLAMAIRQLAATYEMHYPLVSLTTRQAYILVFIALGLGWLGAKLSVNRQIASIEPYS